MAKTKTIGVVRQLTGPMPIVFNDRLKNGVRSVKVWGWRVADYERAVMALEAAGLKSKIVFFESYSHRGGYYFTQPRLHVIE